MAKFKIVATNHTGFTVSSLDRTIPIFTRLFGFRQISREPRDPRVISAIVGLPGADVEVAYLRRDDHTVELLEYRGPSDRGKVECRPCDAGAAHIAFTVHGIESIVESAAELGLVPIATTVVNPHGPNAGARIAYLIDSDGLTIELIEPPARS